MNQLLCLADLDCGGAVDFGDILAILAAWGNDGGPEDLDGSGTVDFGEIRRDRHFVQKITECLSSFFHGDILVVLGAWGPCE